MRQADAAGRRVDMESSTGRPGWLGRVVGDAPGGWIYLAVMVTGMLALAVRPAWSTTLTCSV